MAKVVNIIGREATYFFLDDGSIYTCGRNDYAQLGLGYVGRNNSVNKLNIDNLKQICFGELHTIFVLNDGNCLACGNNKYGQCGVNTREEVITDLRDVHIGDVKKATTCGLYTVFELNSGQIALTGAAPFEKIYRDGPVLVDDLNSILKRDNDTLIRINGDYINVYGSDIYGLIGKHVVDLKDVQVGGEHVVALNKHGGVFTWGSNDFGQLGYDTKGMRYSDLMASVNIKEHTLFLNEYGELFGCGSNKSGQLGLGDNIESVIQPRLLATDVIFMTATSFGTIYGTKEGNIYATGNNLNNALGLKEFKIFYYFARVPDFVFDTTVHELTLPPDVDVSYSIGGIDHNLIVKFIHEGKGLVSIKPYISTPSKEQINAYGPGSSLTFNTSNVHTVEEVVTNIAENYITNMKNYIQDNTIFHREKVMKKKTIIRFSNGSTLEYDGEELTEEECKRRATEYINNKYLYAATDRYKENDFTTNKVYIEGYTTWTPSKGAKTLVIGEAIVDNYNNY